MESPQEQDEEEDNQNVFTLPFLARVWDYALRCREDCAKIAGMWANGDIPATPNGGDPKEIGEKVLGPATQLCRRLFDLLAVPSGRELTPIETSTILSSYPHPSTLPCPNYTSSMELSYRTILESVTLSNLPPSSLPFSTVSNRVFSTTFIASLLSGTPLQPPTNRQEIDSYVSNVRDPVETLAAGVFLGRCGGDLSPYIDNQGLSPALISAANGMDALSTLASRPLPKLPLRRLLDYLAGALYLSGRYKMELHDLTLFSHLYVHSEQLDSKEIWAAYEKGPAGSVSGDVATWMIEAAREKTAAGGSEGVAGFSCIGRLCNWLDIPVGSVLSPAAIRLTIESSIHLPPQVLKDFNNLLNTLVSKDVHVFRKVFTLPGRQFLQISHLPSPSYILSQVATTGEKGGVYVDAARRVLMGRTSLEAEKVWLMAVICGGPCSPSAGRDVEELLKIAASVAISTPTTPPNYPLLTRALEAMMLAVKFLRVHHADHLPCIIKELFEQRRFVDSLTSMMTFAVTTGVSGWETMSLGSTLGVPRS
ncbi:hypothetical protein TrRE_jg7947, partial [Triparma retinervis]